MQYGILRVEKRKTLGVIGGSAKHTHREIRTPNADATLTPTNEHGGAVGSDAIRAAVAARLPEKRRSDAVLCLEYLATFTPGSFDGRADAERRYFEDVRAWLEARHGSENLVSWSIHRDEKTPHLVAYVVPLDGERLNAKRWTGGKRLLSQMQTDFAKDVCQKYGLQRGIEGSRACHEDVKTYYGRVEAEKAQQVPSFNLPAPKGFLESRDDYAKRCVDDFRQHLAPAWQDMVAQSAELPLERRRREAAEKYAKTVEPFVTRLIGLLPDEKKAVADEFSLLVQKAQAARAKPFTEDEEKRWKVIQKQRKADAEAEKGEDLER